MNTDPRTWGVHSCLVQLELECVACEVSGCRYCIDFVRLSDDSGASELFCSECARAEVV